MEKPIEQTVYELLKEKQYTVTTAESCTGGMIASTLVNVSGISEFFYEGYVTYSNAAKIKLLGVDESVIDTFGVVSEQTAEAMAQGAAYNAKTNAAVSVTGEAGPNSASTENPVGLVYIGCFLNGKTVVERHLFSGDRNSIRRKACECALKLLALCIQTEEKEKTK